MTQRREGRQELCFSNAWLGGPWAGLSFSDTPHPQFSPGTLDKHIVTFFFSKPKIALLEEFGIKQLENEFRVNHHWKFHSLIHEAEITVRKR